jgi:uncharacterized protein (DUF58 family)
MTRELQATQPDHRSDVSAVFPQVAARVRRRGLVLIVSDLFLDPEDLEKGLKQLQHRRQEVVVFHVLHDDELTFPFRDNTLFRGLEDEVELMAEPPALRERYLSALNAFRRRVRRTCSQTGMDYVPLNTSESLRAALSRYLAGRARVHHTYGHI